MRTCCVLGCEKLLENDVIYFEFPTSRTLRRKWLDAVQLTGKLTVNSIVCSAHFTANDYEKVRGKVRLKRKVVPSLFHRDNLKKPAPVNNDATNGEVDPHETQQELPKAEPNETPTSEAGSAVENKAQETRDPLPRVSDLARQSINNESINDKIECKEKNKSIEESKKIEENTECNYAHTNGSRFLKVKKLSRLIDKSKLRTNNNVLVDTCVQPPLILDPDPKQDIEEMITNYHIRNKPNTLVGSPVSPPRQIELEVDTSVVEVDARVVEKEPVFIELAVDHNGKASEAPSNGDCLMVLESVQVEVDPSSLMLPERYEDSDDDVIVTGDGDSVARKESAISLLTSSDEDEVIIQEPHIDTVEVSDETDEDDIPLVRLANPKRLDRLRKLKNDVPKFMWMYSYCCIQCRYSTKDKADYTRHLKRHETVLHVCQICGYTTSSKSQYTRHTRKHKEEKRFKCHLCEYKARHQMSLVYHIRSHESGGLKRYVCELCPYDTDRRDDLKRHRTRHVNKDLKT